jgi:hypothetical protein
VKLDQFFQVIGPLLTGQASLGATTPRLYGADAAGRHARDAERLAIYERFCRNHRFQVIDGVYPHCRWAVRRESPSAWDELVESYFRVHPMRSFELNENGAVLPAFLAKEAGRLGLPPFLPELADFECWEWQTQIAPDVPEDRAPDRGPLRLGSTVELRRYGYDLLGWLDGAGEGERAPAPPAEESLVLFWRDRDLDTRREPASVIEILVLRTVNDGGSIEALLAQGTALPRADLEETVADLRQAGILLGQP